MQDILTILDHDIFWQNCRYGWIVFPLFLILAAVMLRTDIKARKRLGKVLLGFSIPGMLVALISFGISLYRFFIMKSYIDPVTHVLNTDVDKVIGLGNESLTIFALSGILMQIEGIAALIAGILMLRKGCGRIAGILAIVLGILSAAAGIFFAYVFVLSLGN